MSVYFFKVKAKNTGISSDMASIFNAEIKKIDNSQKSSNLITIDIHTKSKDMKLSKFIIKEEKRNGAPMMIVLNKYGDYVGDVTPRNGYHTIEYRILGNEILARRHNHPKTNYDIIREGVIIGRFFKSGAYQSDIEFNLDGKIFQFSIFSSGGYKTAKIMSNGLEIGMLSTKKNFLKVEYGLAINGEEHVELMLTFTLLHIQYQKNITLRDENIFI